MTRQDLDRAQKLVLDMDERKSAIGFLERSLPRIEELDGNPDKRWFGGVTHLPKLRLGNVYRTHEDREMGQQTGKAVFFWGNDAVMDIIADEGLARAILAYLQQDLKKKEREFEQLGRCEN